MSGERASTASLRFARRPGTEEAQHALLAEEVAIPGARPTYLTRPQIECLLTEYGLDRFVAALREAAERLSERERVGHKDELISRAEALSILEKERSIREPVPIGEDDALLAALVDIESLPARWNRS